MKLYTRMARLLAMPHTSPPKPHPNNPTTITITPHLGYYAVQYPDGKYHLVSKDKACHCSLGRNCPSIQLVARYLAHGGQRALAFPADKLIPTACPICGGSVRFAPTLSRPGRPGWVCITLAQTEGPKPRWASLPGEAHFRQAYLCAAKRRATTLEVGHVPALS